MRKNQGGTMQNKRFTLRLTSTFGNYTTSRSSNTPDISYQL